MQVPEKLIDHFGNFIPEGYEADEQTDIDAYLPEHAKVLEIGGRFGVVSCKINSILKDKTKHIVVEPDERVWAALWRNRECTLSEFQIVEGSLSRKKVGLCNPLAHCGRLGAGSMFRQDVAENETSVIQNFTYRELKEAHQFVPDTLVIDCEGAFVEMFEDFPEMLEEAATVFIEWDARNPKQNTRYRKKIVEEFGFKEIKGGFHSVYKKQENQ